MTSAPALPATIAATRVAAVALTLLLIVLCLTWELVLAPTGRGTLALKALPLLLPLPGLVRMRLYTYRWTSLLVWLYVAEGAVRAPGERGIGMALGIAEVLLAMALFAVCALHVRARLRNVPEVSGLVRPGP